MTIINRPNPWHKGFDRNGQQITEVVIHATGGIGAIRYVEGGERKAEYLQGIALFHYCVESAGSVVQIVDDDRWVYHSSSGGYDAGTIGIETENDRINGTFNAAQIEILQTLIFEQLMAAYPIKTISTHSYNFEHYSPDAFRKWAQDHGQPYSCPGSSFPWSIFEIGMSARRIAYRKVQDGNYEII